MSVYLKARRNLRGRDQKVNTRYMGNKNATGLVGITKVQKPCRKGLPGCDTWVINGPCLTVP